MTFINNTGVNFEKMEDKWIHISEDNPDAVIRVVYLVDLSDPNSEEGQKFHARKEEVLFAIDDYWPTYKHAYRDCNGQWFSFSYVGGKHAGSEIDLLSLNPWKYTAPSDHEVSAWKAQVEKETLVSDKQALIIMSEIVRLVHDIGAGKHNGGVDGGRGTSQVSFEIMMPIAEEFSALDWNNVTSTKKARQRLSELCQNDTAIFREYEALWSFAMKN